MYTYTGYCDIVRPTKPINISSKSIKIFRLNYLLLNILESKSVPNSTGLANWPVLRYFHSSILRNNSILLAQISRVKIESILINKI